MNSKCAWLAAAVLIFTGGGGAAQSIESARSLFPTDVTPRQAGATTVVRVGTTAADALRISPVTFISRPGTNDDEGSKSMCGLIIVAPGRQPQGVVTVGTGVTDATPSCDAVLAIGAVPAPLGGTVRRIGIIHAVSSRNAANGRTAVVLRRDSAGNWSVDADATERADTITHYTLAELRRTLQRVP
jgi:hypothetical protein